MAEWKYDLALVNTLTDKKVRSQAWYKERLKTKFLKNRKPGDLDKSLVGAKWQFAHDGLDDFRDGLPPNVEGSIMVKGCKQLEPNLYGDSYNKYPMKKSLSKGRFTKEEVAYSKVTPLQQQRRDHINELEAGLLQHPLALYPHLEESIPPDVFEDVVDILDPEMNMYSDDEEDEEEEEGGFGEQFLNESSVVNSSSEKGSKEVKPEMRNSTDLLNEGEVKNPYRWLPKKEEQVVDDKRLRQRRPQSPSQDEHIKNVTKEFCDWVSGLGGESNNIEEATIHSLFASGYETKPALSVPIHVVELTNVPQELRMSATVSHEEPRVQSLQDIEQTQKQLYNKGYTPSWIKSKYGAWYLDPSSWKLRRADEPLEDPQSIKDKEMSESKKKSLAMDEQLAPLHGAKSFKDFVEKKDTRVPEFLERVAMFQAKAIAEQEAAATAESGHVASNSGVGSTKAYSITS
ncbi:protein FAM47E-like isoform X2 [Apostichopus japonicus]|uniref:protein FAM47E-like isoform X2 n=1 Tax=Stichopus japonicus TaxID=307972 RepID=UPI003AB2C8B5